MNVKCYILLVALPLLLLSSKCNDKPIFSKQTKILRGRLMYDCNTPAANEPVRFKASPAFIETIDGEIEVYTDEDGYFEFVHNSADSWYQLWAPYKTLEHIPSKPELDLGEIILNEEVNFIIKLDVQNVYSNLDTLLIPDYNSLSPNAQLSFVGPFYDGMILDSVYNRSYMSFPIRYGEAPNFNINYFFTPVNELRFLYFPTPFCTSNFAEAIISI